MTDVGAHGAIETVQEAVTCPECGEISVIDPTARRAADFCAYCDFPLFWAKASVVAFTTADTSASLRRLPGTEGKAAAAAVNCPHCGEPNNPTALLCLRCSLPMIVAEPIPEPEPDPEPDPEPEPEPEPEPDDPAYLWWAIFGLVAALAIVLVVWAVIVGG